MPFWTIVIGLVLGFIGLHGYFDFGGILGVQEHSPTALIPAAVGAALVLCGALALNPRLRKHAMHAAALIGLLGFLGAIYRPIKITLQNGTLDVSLVSVQLQLAMAVICLLFAVICVQSFVAARRRRSAGIDSGAR